MSKRKNLLGSIFHNKIRGTYRFKHGRNGSQKTFKTKKDAETYQLAYTDKLKTEGTGVIDTLKMTKEVQAAVDLLLKNDLPASSLIKAVERYIEQTSPSNRNLSFTDALDAAMTTKAFLKLKKASRANNRQHWQAFELYVGSKIKLSDITESHIRGFIEKKCIPTMHHRYFTSLNALWEKYFINTAKLTKYNPLSDYVEPPTKPLPAAKIPYTQSETFRLLDALEEPQLKEEDYCYPLSSFPPVAVAMNIAFYTGIRVSEVCKIQVEDFMRGGVICWDEPDEAYIHLSALKTKKEDVRDAYMPSALIAYLRNNEYFLSLRPEDKIFPKNADTLNRYNKAACKGAGIEWKGTAVARSTFATHAVKHWLGTIDKVQAQLGHTTDRMTLKSYAKYANKKDCESYFGRMVSAPF